MTENNIESIKVLIADAFQEGMQTKCRKEMSIQVFNEYWSKSRTIKKLGEIKMDGVSDIKRYALNGKAEEIKTALNDVEQAYWIIKNACDCGYGPQQLPLIRDMLKTAIIETDDKFAELFLN